MYKANEKGTAQLFLVALLAFVLLTISGVVFYKTFNSSEDVQGYSIAQVPATTPCSRDTLICSATPKTCCTGYSLRTCTVSVGVAKDRPFAATKGTVCVKTVTAPSNPTTPADKPLPLKCGVAPRCRIPSGAACCKGFEASTEGCANQSFKRCLPIDTDGDDIPDLWDDDINGDGTPDVQNPSLYGRNSRIFTLPTTPPPVK